MIESTNGYFSLIRYTDRLNYLTLIIISILIDAHFMPLICLKPLALRTKPMRDALIIYKIFRVWLRKYVRCIVIPVVMLTRSLEEFNVFPVLREPSSDFPV